MAIPPLPAAMRYLDATYNEVYMVSELPADSAMIWLRLGNNFFLKELPSGIGNLAALQQLYVVSRGALDGRSEARLTHAPRTTIRSRCCPRRSGCSRP